MRKASPDGLSYDCKACVCARSGKWQKANRGRAAAHTMKSQRGKLERRAGRPMPERCEVCGCKSTDGRSLHFDHDHTTHEFRGWLCNVCNLVLGMCKDDPVQLREREFFKLAAYIEAYRARCLARGSPS